MKKGFRILKFKKTSPVLEIKDLSKSFLVITKNVIIEDPRGKMIADKLFFDIKKQTLKIAAFEDNKINANINLK